MRYFVSFSRFLGWCFLLGIFGGGIIASSIYLYLAPQLPEVEQLRHTQLQVPLRIYSSDHKLIAEFGEKRRIPVNIEEVPELFKKAFIAAEDNRFYSHQGVDIKGLLRASFQLATTGRIQSGGSTITMQVAKNFFLSREKTFTRKFSEILLALQIEQELKKDEILELYFNKIYLGNRAYGIGAAAQVYYGLPFNQLSLAQMAMIAGLPKAPSKYNPLADAERSLVRRDWILMRMHELGFISVSDYEEAKSAPITASYHGAEIELEAPYLAEMARKYMLDSYGESAYENGYQVYLTVESKLQRQANLATVEGLESYDRRHGYRGPLAQMDEAERSNPDHILQRLRSITTYNDLIPAAVTAATDMDANLLLSSGQSGRLVLENLQWARQYINVNQKGEKIEKVSDVLQPGDIILVRAYTESNEKDEQDTPLMYSLAQLPTVQGSLISLNPQDGAITALTGGYSFYQSKYNRALQAKRQPGSNFKPFIYLAALEEGETAASLINDAPIVYDDTKLESAWRPENSSGKFFGPTRLREALYKSRNLVSIRLLKRTGIKKTLNYVERFGFDTSSLPQDLSLALGSAGIPPMDIARGYAMIANGGFSVSPYFISKIEDSDNKLVYEASPDQVCPACEQLTHSSPEISLPPHIARYGALGNRPFSIAKRIADERSIYIMHSILKDVITSGTGRKARVLGRSDVAGKTGTTNDQKDAWFSGFAGGLVTTVWVGFDQPETLGRREYGAAAALPIWIDYMRTAMENRPLQHMKQPPGMVTAKINRDTGLRTSANDPDAIFEIFRTEHVPEIKASLTTPAAEEVYTPTETRAEDIF